MNISKKLIFLFGLITLSATVSAIYSAATIYDLQGQVNAEIVGSASRLDEARQIEAGVANMRSAFRGVALYSLVKKLPAENKAREVFEAEAAAMRDWSGRWRAPNCGPEETGLRERHWKKPGRVGGGIQAVRGSDSCGASQRGRPRWA